MFPRALERRIQFLVLICVFSMTLIVTPWATLDPINPPKFLILGTCGLALIGSVAPYSKRMFTSKVRPLVSSVMVFLFLLVLTLLVSDAGKLGQIYGAYGRNTGLVTYVSLALILTSVVFVSNTTFVKKLILTLVVTGAMNAIYGLIQWSGNDPVDWNNPYNPIVGTLGNPNFISAHLGISSLANLALLLEKGKGYVTRIALIANVLLALFVMFESNSSQGLFVFALCMTLILYFRFRNSCHRFVRVAYWLVIGGLSALGAFGILNKGPFAQFLYQLSVTYRGDYWRAGWKMTTDNPIFGVGLDSYGDWYRFSRTQEATLRRGPDITSNSAHNVFLDISSNGGFFLLAAYLLIVGMIVRSAWRVLRKSSGFDAVGVGLVSGWLAYIIQSVISINQLGLAIWGWVLGGAIIGYDFFLNQPDAPNVKLKQGYSTEKVSAAVVLTGSLGLAIGFIISVWPMVHDMSFRKALEVGDAVRIVEASKEFPQNSYYMVYSAQIFLENGVYDKALDLAKSAIELNPRDFNGWKMLLSNPQLSAEEKASAIAKMKKLDPFNNTLDKR